MSARSVDNGLPPEVRRQKMLRAVRTEEFARVADLSQRFDVSEVTVRNDLSLLERRGELRRVRGGAMSTSVPRHEASFETASVTSAAEKERIGVAAAALVTSGEAVILDVGSTVAAMAQALVRREELTEVMVFTSGLNIAMVLEAASPRYTVVVNGGTVRPLQHSLVNPARHRGAVADPCPGGLPRVQRGRRSRRGVQYQPAGGRSEAPDAGLIGAADRARRRLEDRHRLARPRV